jgi:predicted DNA-binding protein
MRRTDPISFRIKAEIKQALERLAKEDKRSLSSYIELALEAHVEAKRENGPGARLRSAKAKR